MSRRYRLNGPSHRELIATVQESASDLIDQQMKRDEERFSYEKQKIGVLILIVLSLWVMFALLWMKLDAVFPDDAAPTPEHRSPPADSTLLPERAHPITIHYA